MGPFSFLTLFLKNKLPQDVAEPQAPLVSSSSNIFDQLSYNDKEVVREYFRSAMAAHIMLDSLRKGVSVLHKIEILARFEGAEKHYCGLGFLPVLPAGLHHKGNRRLSDFQAERILPMGLLVRRVSGELPHFYADAMKQHAEKLLKRKPEAVVASPTVGVLAPRRK